jgi:hypothetical protein
MELQSFLRIGDPIPKVFYSTQATGMGGTYEIAYNHYHNRMGMELPKTEALIEQVLRPCFKKELVVSPGFCFVRPDPGLRAEKITYPADLDIAWEALTHAELGPTKAANNK